MACGGEERGGTGHSPPLARSLSRASASAMRVAISQGRWTDPIGARLRVWTALFPYRGYGRSPGRADRVWKGANDDGCCSASLENEFAGLCATRRMGPDAVVATDGRSPMDRDGAVARLREPEAELKALGVQPLYLFGLMDVKERAAEILGRRCAAPQRREHGRDECMPAQIM